MRGFNLNLNNVTDWFKMDAIKKSLCHFDYSQSGSNDLSVDLPSPDREESVQMKLPHDFCRFTGLTVFFDGLISPTRLPNCAEFFTQYEGCAEDIYGAGMRNIPRKSVPVKRNEKIEAKTPADSSALLDSKDNSLAEPPLPAEKMDPAESMDQSRLMELHRAIFWSISRCATDEQMKRMLKNIVIVGGGYALFPGALEFLKKKLEEIVPPTYEIDFVANTREVPADLHAYKGASIMAALDTVQYLWITKEVLYREICRIL